MCPEAVTWIPRLIPKQKRVTSARNVFGDGRICLLRFMLPLKGSLRWESAGLMSYLLSSVVSAGSLGPD